MIKHIATAARLVLFTLLGSPFAAAAASFPALPAPVVNDALWRPTPQMRWQLQFATTPVDLTVEADVYKIDLFDNDASVIADLKGRGKNVVCYLNAGAWEDWRPDARHFPRAAMGKHYEGWPGERWLDIRRIDLLAPIMLARLDLCRDKGFDGVMLDNIDSYTHKTGFPLSSADQLHYIAWIANEARRRGLAVGINNNPAQALLLLPYFDWALAESCFSHGWCARLLPIVEAGKPVVVIEYTDDQAKQKTMCQEASALRFTLMIKKRDLAAFRQDCGNDGGSRGTRPA